uniref:PAS domain-containing protein n=1 Tax=Pygocentrus nattereri TaxID=42514 RepID=A0A3B4EG79_PYGNA
MENMTVLGHRDLMVSCRSTKSASKARRDHINAEIRNMRALLPISAEDQERLSYLHTMAIICTFIRKTALLTGETDGEKSDEGLVPPHEDLLQALPGFIVVMTSQGKLVCVSENVSQYLGFSMVEILQSDTFYDLIHADDVDSVKLTLEGDLSAAGEKRRSFVCHMNTSKAFRLQYGSCCPLLVRGHYQDPQHSLFVALCAPTMDRLMDTERLSFRTHFQSVHRADMILMSVLFFSVVLYLGYEAEELIGRSWYSMLHPDDLSLTASAHTHLSDAAAGSEEMVELVFRVQTKTLLWIWIFSRASKFTHKQEITCTNFLISEAEALYLRQKLYSAVSAPPLTPPISQMPWGSTSRDHRDRSADRSLFSTPPYSPASSVSDDSLDTLQDVMSPSFSSSLPSSSSSLSSSSSSLPFQHLQPLPVLRNSFSVEPCPLPPPTLSYPEGPAEASLVPDYQPEGCESSPDCVLHYRNFTPEDSGSSSLVELLTSGPSLTVHESTLSNLSYTEREQAEISVLAHQISSLASSFDLYRAKSHNSNFTCAPCWPSAITLPTELLLDEDVIDSILRDSCAAFTLLALVALCDWGSPK